ncbi:MAG: extracellular solute-binding protein [Oscillospiraceae bacterium]|jgi:ABC-type glycerol-3-phosphate transport system substrate-binding protein|nr:extracellular solute-binding protein [Oscillospiraceae bacterium]
MKKITSLILVLALITSVFAGCKTKKETPEVAAPPETALAYAPQYISVPSNLTWIRDLRVVGDKAYFLAITDVSDSFAPYSMNLDGTEIAALTGFNPPEEGRYVHAMRVDNDLNNYCLDANFGVTVTDAGGRELFALRFDGTRWANGLLQRGDGIYALINESSVAADTKLISIDPDARSWGTTTSVPKQYFAAESDGEYDFWYGDLTGIYGYTIETKRSIELMKWSEADIAAASVSSFAVLRDGGILCALNVNNTAQLVLLTLQQPADTSGKTELTLASMGNLPAGIAEQVAKFNRESAEYKIVTTEYPSMFSLSGTNTEALDAFNLMLISGNIPDIILTNTRIPQGIYTSKGVFEDLYPYLDADENLGGRAALVPSVLSALETDGKLYQLVYDFDVWTVASPRSAVGDRTSWTVDEALELAKSFPDGTPIIANGTADQQLEYIMIFGASDFIAWQTGECRFDSEDFIKQLEFANSFPHGEPVAPSIEAIMNGTYIQPQQLAADGKAVAATALLMNFDTHRAFLDDFGMEITYVGYPTAHGSGTAFSNLSAGISMSASSAHKDGAWAFIRTLLSYDFQMAQFGGMLVSLPTNVAALDEYARRAMEDENLKMTQEEIDTVRNLIAVTEKWERDDFKILAIISEEAAPYFAGQKTAAEAAKLIQSRASLYVNEQK